MNLDIQIIERDDVHQLKALISVFSEVFEMRDFVLPPDSHLSNLLQQRHFFAVTAKYESRVIGGLTVYVLDQCYSTRPLAYIMDLAVLGSFQRKGVGRRLIASTNNHCRQSGFEECFVQAEKVDDYAIDFYRSTGPSKEEAVVHFSYFF